MFGKGRYAGEPIDSSSRRSIELLGGKEGSAIVGTEDTVAVLNYFYHDSRFWKAVIPLDAVDSVFGQSFNFSKPKTRKGPNGPEIVYDADGVPMRSISMLNHLQSRFMLKAGHVVNLFEMDDESMDHPQHKIDDFIYTVEAVGPSGVMFNVRDGLAGNLISAHRFLSTQEMVFERIVVGGQHVTESPALPLKEEEKRAYLTATLLRGQAAGMNERYYLFRLCGTNNCASNPFQILDKIVRYTMLQRLGSLLYRLPLKPRFYLRVRGMDSDPSVRRLLRKEFSQYIKDPATRKRKRDFVRSTIRALRKARDSRR